ncbi:hypothetical protein E1211_09820 [Micromonospora sp. 15K316]|uniref:hypothetical protein n=1 Tax=Micromonospora sp. 15K316 TaxID=2530376 RepID=UPI001050A9F2|nr:hypothetical protein [Micromonospora sp. 15K316]TDC37591.1 hypothetical protein E1211_09820 [Micromonospora sp. 15K316]
MTIGTWVPQRRTGSPPLDYYLLLDRPGGLHESAEAIVVEEFVRAPDWSTVGLRSTAWTPGAGWRSSASFSRAMRGEPELRARVRPVPRDAADATHRRLGGGPLADETSLRAHFHDHQAFPTTAPLRLGTASAPPGCHERRMYRVLFAGEPAPDRMAGLAAHWRPTVDPAADGAPGGHRRLGDDRFSWTVRRIGGGLAWALDLTAELARPADEAVGPIMQELTSAVRLAGLIPVTTERFA